MPQRSRRVSMASRLAALEARAVVCRTCAEVDPHRFRVLSEEEFERMLREGEWQDLCPECGTERRQPLTFYKRSQWEAL